MISLYSVILYFEKFKKFQKVSKTTWNSLIEHFHKNSQVLAKTLTLCQKPQTFQLISITDQSKSVPKLHSPQPKINPKNSGLHILFTWTCSNLKFHGTSKTEPKPKNNFKLKNPLNSLNSAINHLKKPLHPRSFSLSHSLHTSNVHTYQHTTYPHSRILVYSERSPGQPNKPKSYGFPNPFPRYKRETPLIPKL